jgi:triacylglycerol lipase
MLRFARDCLWRALAANAHEGAAMALDPKNTAYNLDNALACAKASLLAYDDKVTSAKVADAFGLNVSDLVAFDGAGTDAKGFLAQLDGAIAIVFRGTDSIANWIDDAEILPLPFRDKGAVHSGFLDSLQSVWPTISATLGRWKGGGRTLWITGHSLGGALALLAAATLRFPAGNGAAVPTGVAGTYTFGQPRVGTRDFAQACDADFGDFYFRFVNNADIVPRIPPRVLGYWHAGKLEYIDGGGAIHSDISWWHEALDSVEVGIEGLRKLQATKPALGALEDHSMALYLAAIQAAWNAARQPARAPADA